MPSLSRTGPDPAGQAPEGHGPDGATPRRATALLDHILSQAAQEVGQGGGAPTISLGDLFDRMEERSYGVLLLLLALPCCLPFVYVLPQIVALPMMLLALQMAMGRPTPWLPDSVRARRFSVASLQTVVDRSRRFLGMFEAIAHPRLAFLTGHLGSRVTGALLAIPCLSILVPLPLTNTAPGVGVAVASFAIIERDGLLLLLGLAIGLLWVGLLVLGGQAAVGYMIEIVRGLMGG